MVKIDHFKICFIMESLLGLSNKYFIDIYIEFTLIYLMILDSIIVVVKTTIFIML